MPKVFKCSAFKGQHQRPTGAKCKYVNSINETEDLNNSLTNSDSSSIRADAQSRDNDIINALQAVSLRLSAIEQRIERTEEKLEAAPAQTGPQSLPEKPLPNVSSNIWSIDQHQDTVIPSIQTLQGSQMIQKQVDERLQQLSQLNEKGTFKSQRGGTDIVWVKKQTPWPQNFILGVPVKIGLIMIALVCFNGCQDLPKLSKKNLTQPQKMPCWNICQTSWMTPKILGGIQPKLVTWYYYAAWKKEKLHGKIP